MARSLSLPSLLVLADRSGNERQIQFKVLGLKLVKPVTAQIKHHRSNTGGYHAAIVCCQPHNNSVSSSPVDDHLQRLLRVALFEGQFLVDHTIITDGHIGAGLGQRTCAECATAISCPDQYADALHCQLVVWQPSRWEFAYDCTRDIPIPFQKCS
eukprot:SAG22_NODE_128_length_18787_cov_19.577108_2_plen_155_part_00